MFLKKILFLMVFSIWQAAVANEAAIPQGTPEAGKPIPQANESTKAQPNNPAAANGNANETSNQNPPTQRIPLNVYCKDHTC